MTWLLVLVTLTYCFTVAYTNKYKEDALKARENELDYRAEIDKEVLVLLEQNNKLQNKYEELRRAYDERY